MSNQVSEPVVAYDTEKRDMSPEELYAVIVDDVKELFRKR